MNDTTLPRVAITMGDPAGIGPEVAMKAVADKRLLRRGRWLIIGEAWLANQWNPTAGDKLHIISDPSELSWEWPIAVWDSRQLKADELISGRIDARYGRASLEYVKTAVTMCRSGLADAMVTGPLCKEAVVLSGQAGFCGHTEYLAEQCGAVESRLMLYHEKLRVVHVSTHVRLADAIRLCTTERVLKTIEIGHHAMQRLGWRSPRVAVCGLNPHAGENGLFGDEEVTEITPAIHEAQLRGIACHGPFPADTLLLQAARGSWDLVVAMYHDQSHVAMKLFDFEHTVNVTLGLPIIRTSVDHGTAFDIAGMGKANSQNMTAAMELAIRLCQTRETNH